MLRPAEAQAVNPFELALRGIEPPDDGFDESVYQRPVAVVTAFKPLSAPERKMGFADWPIPERASQRAKNVATVIASIQTCRLGAGWGNRYLFRRAALGKHQIAAMAKKIGIKMSPNTAAAGLRDLGDLGCLSQVGQLGEWQDWEANGQWKKGVFLYRLNNVGLRLIRKPRVGRLGMDGFLQDATLRSTRHRSNIHAALKWAKNQAKLSIRNETGRWFAWRCLEKGLTEGETWAVMADYHQSVPQCGHAYTMREVRATVRSAPASYARHHSCLLRNLP